MKHLYLLRHAKSSWDEPAVADFDRPLNARGLETAPFMGELMAERAIRPDLIISSPAKRALETALLVKEASGTDSPLRVDERVYEASPLTLRTVISQVSDEISSVLLVGHNPGMEGLVRHLTGEVQTMPTASLAFVTLNIDSWRAADTGTGILNFLLRPKEEMKRAGGAQ